MAADRQFTNGVQRDFTHESRYKPPRPVRAIPHPASATHGPASLVSVSDPRFSRNRRPLLGNNGPGGRMPSSAFTNKAGDGTSK